MSETRRRGYRFPDIVRWMAARNMTQQALANQMGVSVNTLRNMIWGTGDPRLYTVQALLRVTGTTFEYAFKEADRWQCT